MSELHARIAGIGRYLPDNVVTNDDLAKIVDTNDEWIRERTGIATRRIEEDPEKGAAYMAAEAARVAIDRSGFAPEEIDTVILSTATPDRFLPSTACDTQAILGLPNAMALDLTAACSGWLYGLTMGEGMIASGRSKATLVVATEKMSGIVDWTDRATCVLFGDGAGAVVLAPANGDGTGIVSSFHCSDGNLGELLWRPAGGNICPMTPQTLENRDHLLKMNGREIFKSAVRSMAQACDEALSRAGMTGEDVDLLVPHQANIRIIQATAKYAGIPMEKVYVNVDRYGNMSSASIPVALDEALEDGSIQPGMRVLAPTFGAGLTWGAVVLQF